MTVDQRTSVYNDDENVREKVLIRNEERGDIPNNPKIISASQLSSMVFFVFVMCVYLTNLLIILTSYNIMFIVFERTSHRVATSQQFE